MNQLFIRNPLTEIFIIYTDNFPAGIFKVSEYDVEVLVEQLENETLPDFMVAEKTFIKSDIGTVRIGGNIAIQLNFQEN